MIVNKSLLALTLVTLVLFTNLFTPAVKGATKSEVANNDATFELYNKDGIIDFKLVVEGGTVLKSDWGTTPRRFTLQDGAIGRAQIKVTDPSKFLLYLEIYNSRGIDKYTIRPGQKTVFVSYSEKHTPALYQQTGTLKGLSGKAKSGLSLKNNLKATDIVPGDNRPTASGAKQPTAPKVKNYYEVLGVARDATQDDIKKAYRKLALVRHPDKPTGSQALFTELNTANEILSDPAKRAAYDRTLPQ